MFISSSASSSIADQAVDSSLSERNASEGRSPSLWTPGPDSQRKNVPGCDEAVSRGNQPPRSNSTIRSNRSQILSRADLSTRVYSASIVPGVEKLEEGIGSGSTASSYKDRTPIGKRPSRRLKTTTSTVAGSSSSTLTVAGSSNSTSASIGNDSAFIDPNSTHTPEARIGYSSPETERSSWSGCIPVSTLQTNQPSTAVSAGTLGTSDKSLPPIKEIIEAARIGGKWLVNKQERKY